MNSTGNVRYQFTEEIIEKALLNLLKRKRYDGFTIKDLCIEAGINRSSFYAHYQDINELMIKMESKLAKKMQAIWIPKSEYNQDVLVEMFTFVKEYKQFYKAFLKSHNPSFVAPEMLKKQKEHFKQIIFSKNLDYSDNDIDYGLHFFGGGLKAVCGFWLQNDCKETPEQIAKIIRNEYENKAQYFTPHD